MTRLDYISLFLRCLLGLFLITSLIGQLSFVLFILYNGCSFVNIPNLIVLLIPIPITIIAIYGLFSNNRPKRIFTMSIVSISITIN